MEFLGSPFFRLVHELEFPRVEYATQTIYQEPRYRVGKFSSVGVAEFPSEVAWIPIPQKVKRLMVAGNHGERPAPLIPCLANSRAIFRVPVFGGTGQKAPIFLFEEEPEVPN